LCFYDQKITLLIALCCFVLPAYAQAAATPKEVTKQSLLSIVHKDARMYCLMHGEAMDTCPANLKTWLWPNAKAYSSVRTQALRLLRQMPYTSTCISGKTAWVVFYRDKNLYTEILTKQPSGVWRIDLAKEIEPSPAPCFTG